MMEKKTNPITKVKAAIFGVFLFLIVTMSLFHVFFDANSKEYINHKKTYVKILKKRDSNLANVISNYQKKVKLKFPDNEELQALSNNLSLEYSTQFALSKLKIKEYSNTTKILAKEHSFIGRSSFHFWIFAFGLVAALLFFSCKSLYNDIVHGSTYKFQFISFAGITISFFWVIHLLFYTQKDFNKNSYVALILFCAVLASVFTYFLVKHYTYKDDMILKQLSLIERIKTIHYPLVAAKAKYAEKYGENSYSITSVEDDVNEFDNDIKTSLKI